MDRQITPVANSGGADAFLIDGTPVVCDEPIAGGRGR
jgi:hypothetical protein